VQQSSIFRCQHGKGPAKSQPMRLTSLLTTIALLLGLPACNKDKDPNPFENETKLDCNNLRVRKVTYIPQMNPTNTNIHVLIENTCNTCEDDWMYLGLFMIDRTTNDTIARTSCSFCLPGVKNNTWGDYFLQSNLTSLPDLKNIRFDYSYLCNDVPYEPVER
jgi:hypothetical protein